MTSIVSTRRPKPNIFNDNLVKFSGLNQEKQVELLTKYFAQHKINPKISQNSANAVVFYKDHYYKYIEPHVASYYNKMIQNIPTLLEKYHPEFKIIEYDGHNIMKTKSFGVSLKNEADFYKMSYKESIKNTLREFIDNGFYHGDLIDEYVRINYNNVLIDKENKKIMLIDFGLTSKKETETLSEAETNQIVKEKDRLTQTTIPPTPAGAPANKRPIFGAPRKERSRSKQRTFGSTLMPPPISRNSGVFTYDSPPRISRVSTFDSPPSRRTSVNLFDSPSRGEGYIKAKVHKLI